MELQLHGMSYGVIENFTNGIQILYILKFLGTSLKEYTESKKKFVLSILHVITSNIFVLSITCYKYTLYYTV